MSDVKSFAKLILRLKPLWVWLWRRTRPFWCEPISPQPLAMMRIAFGIVVLAGVLINTAPYLFDFWSPDGFIPAETAARYAENNNRISLFQLANSNTAAVCWLVLYCIALMMMTVGLFTRVACFAAWLLAMSFSMRGWWVTNGGDDVTVIILFYLMLTPCGVAWSVDSIRRQLKKYKDPATGFDSPDSELPKDTRTIPPWSVRLLQIQFCLIYWYNGLNKINIGGFGKEGYENWQAFLDANDYISGQAVYYALNDNMLNRIPYDALPVPFWICCILSWATIIFELGFPFFILFRPTRRLIVVGGILFHLGILATMEIAWFSQTMIAVYPILISATTATAVVAWLARRGAKQKFLLFYDTFCPICRRSKLALQLMDLGGRITFMDIHDRESMARHAPGVSYSRALKEMIVVRPNGKVDGGYFAFRTIARGLPALWPLMIVMYIPGVSWIGTRIYKAIARNRYRFKACKDDVCNLHLRALSQENIDENEIIRIISNARQTAKVADAHIENGTDLNEASSFTAQSASGTH